MNSTGICKITENLRQMKVVLRNWDLNRNKQAFSLKK